MTRLAVAAFLDAAEGAVRVIGFVGRMALDRVACHHRETRIVASPDVVRLCVRCGNASAV